MPCRVLGDGKRPEGVAGQGLQDGVAVGGDVGAGPAQGDEEFVDGRARLDLQERVAAPCRAGDAADGGAGPAASESGTTGRVGSM